MKEGGVVRGENLDENRQRLTFAGNNLCKTKDKDDGVTLMPREAEIAIEIWSRALGCEMQNAPDAEQA